MQYLYSEVVDIMKKAIKMTGRILLMLLILLLLFTLVTFIIHRVKTNQETALLKEKGSGDPAVFDLRYLKPLDEEILKEAATYGRILTVEEGSLKGGLFGAVTEYMASHDVLVRIHGLGVPDRFIRQDRQSSQRAECGLDAEGIAKAAEALLKLTV